MAGTPATNALNRLGIAFRVHEFDHDPAERHYGLEAARALRVEPDRVFKTLLVSAVPGPGHGVGIVPVTTQLSLKAVATALGVKRVDMCDRSTAERLTGYVVGGISPLGQKRPLPTVVDETCELWDTVFVSGGRRGLDIELAPGDLVAALDAVIADISAA